MTPFEALQPRRPVGAAGCLVYSPLCMHGQRAASNHYRALAGQPLTRRRAHRRAQWRSHRRPHHRHPHGPLSAPIGTSQERPPAPTTAPTRAPSPPAPTHAPTGTRGANKCWLRLRSAAAPAAASSRGARNSLPAAYSRRWWGRDWVQETVVPGDGLTTCISPHPDISTSLTLCFAVAKSVPCIGNQSTHRDGAHALEISQHNTQK